MTEINPLLLCDYYKTEHFKMYPKGMTKLYSNFTPRKSRIPGVDKVVFFGLQYFVKEYLIKKFNREFFLNHSRNFSLLRVDPELEKKEKEELNKRLKSSVVKEYSKYIPVETKHIEALWDLGYLPIEIKALDEGTFVPIGVSCFTITNTHPDFAWLVNYLETLISCMMWQPITSATISFEYKKLLTKYALETDAKNVGFVDWQGHDFSMRGMSSVESAILSGMGHLLSFTGTDTIPAIYQLEQSYKAEGLIGASVPATEHSVMCMGQKESEIDTFRRLLNLYPTGILSIVSDTWDLWKVCTEYLPQLKQEILARDGKLVIRPDSGDPVDILCGRKIIKENQIEELFNSDDDNFGYYKTANNCYVEKDGRFYEFDIYEYPEGGFRNYGLDKEVTSNEAKGVIELLWDTFGGTINKQGYKVLDSHIGAIYGDSITLDRAEQICERLKAKGFASTNIVLGIGSYTYQYNTRDSFGMAMKATYGEITHDEKTGDDKSGGSMGPWIEQREIFKDPVTDDGTKKSKKGLLQVNYDDNMSLVCIDQCTKEQESKGLLTTVFKDGKLIKETNLTEIRNKLNSYINVK